MATGGRGTSEWTLWVVAVSCALHATEEYLTGLINAIFFHALPTVLQGRIAPGLFTAVFLYVPFSTWALLGARRDGVSRAAIARALAGGTAMMTTVVLSARMLGTAMGR